VGPEISLPRSTPIYPRSFDIRRPISAFLLTWRLLKHMGAVMNKPALFYFSTLWIVTATVFAASSHDNDVLALSRQMQLEYRQGNRDVVEPLVKTLEAAVARSGDNAKLWEAMGHAYMSLEGTMYSDPLDVPALIANGERARAAYARSLALDGNNTLALASHGMSTMVVSQLKGDGPGMMAGVEEMNSAVRQEPKSLRTRLTRAFTIVHLPPAMRDTKAVIEDFEFIMDAAPGGRPEDVIHVLLGDVYAETNNLEAARKEYAQVSGASAFALEQSKSHLAELEKGAISPASIGLVRAGTGTCAMCHAPGTDN